MKQFVLFFLFIIPSISWACTCTCSVSTLCEALRSDNVYAVLHIRILDKSGVPDGWTLEVINDFNNSGVPDTIYYGIGGSCSEHITKIDGTPLEVGDEEIIVCEKYDYDATLNIQYYHAYSCAYVELDLIDDHIIGAINSTQDTMSYDSLRSYVSDGYQNDRYCSFCDCSCYYPNPFFLEFDSTFCRTLKLAMLKDPSALVSRLLITEIFGNKVTAEVIDVLRGRETRTEIILWTKFGNECRKAANELIVGSEYVMILQKIGNKDLASPGEKLGDYYLSSCGNHILPIENGIINAKVTNTISRITYAELKREINKPGCHDWIVNNNDPAIRDIEVFPNPATDRVYINLNAAKPVDILFYDINGQVLLNRHFTNQSSIPIDLMDSGLSSSTLLVEIRQEEQTVIKKLLVR